MCVAVAGTLTWDVINGRPPRVGGGPYHAARALRILGQRALLFVSCAPADAGELVTPVRALGIPVVYRPGETAVFVHDYEGDARQTRIDALGSPWAPADVAILPRSIRWAHVAPLTRADFPPETLAALAHGRRISLDGQGLVRPARVGPLVLDSDFDPALLGSVSVLKLSEDEAGLLVDGYDERSLARLGVPEVVVTLGSRGCVVYADGVAELVRAHAVAAPDPTGAGDAFAAAYVVARSRGAAAPAAARRASALVSDLLSGRAA